MSGSGRIRHVHCRGRSIVLRPTGPAKIQEFSGSWRGATSSAASRAPRVSCRRRPLRRTVCPAAEWLRAAVQVPLAQRRRSDLLAASYPCRVPLRSTARPAPARRRARDPYTAPLPDAGVSVLPRHSPRARGPSARRHAGCCPAPALAPRRTRHSPSCQTRARPPIAPARQSAAGTLGAPPTRSQSAREHRRRPAPTRRGMPEIAEARDNDSPPM
jgi:hypothetical protein